MGRIIIAILVVCALPACDFQKAPQRDTETESHPTQAAGGAGDEGDAGSTPMVVETAIRCNQPGGCPADRHYCTPDNLCVQCLADGACDADKPRCDPDAHACVECLMDDQCPQGERPYCTAKHACTQCRNTLDCSDAKAPSCHDGACGACKTNDDCDHIPSRGLCNLDKDSKSKGACVECVKHSDCTDAAKPQCTNNACVPCEGKDADAACTGRKGTPVCNLQPKDKKQGSCVECSVSNENECGDNACDVKQHKCSKFKRQSAGVCKACVGDSQCTKDQHCIDMTYDGAPHGSYCLKQLLAGCLEPFTISIGAPSISGARNENYCGINMETTTCEAVTDAIASKSCEADKDCGVGKGDGACRRVGSLDNKCTYSCGISAQCPLAVDCNDESFCQ